jgi:carbonyl reductase 1
MLPLLQKSASPRIINIASAAGRLSILKSQPLVETFTSNDLKVSTLESLMKEFVQEVENGTHASKGWPNTCYGMSKLGIIALTKVLAREHPDFMVNSVDPGYCATDQNKNQGTIPAARGAVTPVVLATIPASEFVSGLHFFQEQEIAW